MINRHIPFNSKYIILLIIKHDTIVKVLQNIFLTYIFYLYW